MISPLLQSISELPQGTLYFAADGSYRQGALRGNSVPLTEASYIGASARKANRQRQLAELTRDMEIKEDEIRASLAAVASLRQQLQKLQDEYAARPNTSELGQALDILHEAQIKLQQAQVDFDACDERLTEHKSKLDELRSSYLAITSKLPYPCTAANYWEIADLCANYRSQMQSLDNEKRMLESKQSELERWADDISH